ncbi:hypothetical protein D3C87_1758440 [compost metagenome]
MCGINYIALQDQVFINKLGWIRVIGMDPAHLGSSQIDLIDRFICKETLDGLLTSQIQLTAGAHDQLNIVAKSQLTTDGRPDHPPMTCHKHPFFSGALLGHRSILQ